MPTPAKKQLKSQVKKQMLVPQMVFSTKANAQKKLSSANLGSTESLKAVYMGKPLHPMKPASPNNNAVAIHDNRVTRAAFLPSQGKKSNQSINGSTGLVQGKRHANKRSLPKDNRGLKGITILSDQNISFQDKSCLLSPFQERAVVQDYGVAAKESLTTPISPTESPRPDKL